MLTLIFRSDSSFPESSIFIHCPLPIAITKMDESHFSPLGLIKIVRAERSRGRGRRSRGKKQRETARLYEGMVERRGRKNRAEAREREREIWALLSRGRGTLSVTFPRTICPPTFPAVRSSIANILHRHRRFD